ncbi:hypothetical protein ACSBR1_013829 [Camellia fascicularis]
MWLLQLIKLENMTAFEIMGVAACNTNRTCTATLVLSNGQKLGGVGLSEVETRINAENILEERDPQYDAMLGQMAGRIRSKPEGKLEMGELRHIILLHQGKADDHNGHMDFTKIADKFQIDVVQIQKILQSVSLPPEDSNKERNMDSRASTIKMSINQIDFLKKDTIFLKMLTSLAGEQLSKGGTAERKRKTSIVSAAACT